MGIAALWTAALLFAGAGATYLLEPRFSAGGEAGPAARGQVRPAPKPKMIDPWTYYAGPVIALLGTAWAAVVIPFGPELIGADVSIGLFYFIVVVDFVVLGIALAGWGANTPHGIEACYRAVAQLAAYVIPLGLAIIGPIMMARSLSTVAIVEAQADAGLWYVVAQPIGFALYVVCGLMQSYRAPFLEPFAARIDHGVIGHSGGWMLLLWRLALAAVLFVVAAMGAVLFLGGYAGPVLPGPVWMTLKTFGIMILMLWLGRKIRLLTVDEMLRLAWKILIPLGLVNVLIVGALILLGVGQSPFK